MINGKEYTYYEATQEQRRQERQSRQSRRELEALKAIKAPPEEVQKAQAKLSKQLGDYKRFSFSAGIRPKPERYGVINTSTGPVTAKRAVAASRATRESQKKIREQAKQLEKPIFQRTYILLTLQMATRHL